MVAIILGKGFEPIEAIAPCDILRRGGVQVCFAAIGSRIVEGGHGIRVEADCMVDDLKAEELEMVVLPGGLGGVNSILGCEKALDLVKAVHTAGKSVAAICAAPTILAKLKITDGKKATCYPGMEDMMHGALMCDIPTVTDGNVITGRAAGSAEAFGLALLAKLRSEDEAKRIAAQIVSHG